MQLLLLFWKWGDQTTETSVIQTQNTTEKRSDDRGIGDTDTEYDGEAVTMVSRRATISEGVRGTAGGSRGCAALAAHTEERGHVRATTTRAS